MAWVRTGIDNGDQHITPEDEAHDLSLSCWCDPEVREVIHGRMLVVHNSTDGREAVEWASAILNNGRED